MLAHRLPYRAPGRPPPALGVPRGKGEREIEPDDGVEIAAGQLDRLVDDRLTVAAVLEIDDLSVDDPSEPDRLGRALLAAGPVDRDDLRQAGVRRTVDM